MASLPSDRGVPAAGFEHQCGTETERARGEVLDGDPPQANVHLWSAPPSSFILNLPVSTPAFLCPFCSLRSYLCVTWLSLSCDFSCNQWLHSPFSYFMGSPALADLLLIWGWSLGNCYQNKKMQFALKGYQISSINLQEDWPVSWYINEIKSECEICTGTEFNSELKILSPNPASKMKWTVYQRRCLCV